MPASEAVDAVVRFHRDRGIVPRLMLLEGSADSTSVASLVATRGWREQERAMVMVVDLRRLPPALPARASGLVMTWDVAASDAWLALLGRPHPQRRAVLTAVPAHYASVWHEDALVAIARVVVTSDWIGVSCVHVAEQCRSLGVGAWLMGECVHQGLRLGARFGYLQVTLENGGARRLYERLGWREHHRYRYLTLGEPEEQ